MAKSRLAFSLDFAPPGSIAVLAPQELKPPGAPLSWNAGAIYASSPASDVSAPLMRKALAWEIQAVAFGGLSARARRALKAAGGGKTAARTASAGSRLVREWNGATYEVDVLESGYRWRGETWSSLSAVAREITGAKWSGPRVFGLTKRS